MKKVIIINGPIGIGKTTVTKILCNKLKGVAMIDGDWCFNIHPLMENEKTKNIAIDNMSYIVKNYANCNECKYIVLNYAFDNEALVDKVIENIDTTDTKLYKFTLLCDEYSLENRWYNDRFSDWRMEEWLKVSKKSLQSFSKSAFVKIDTSTITANEVAEKIIEMIG